MDKPTLTITEAAKLLGIGRSAAYEAARRGDLPTLSFGRRRVVLSAALEQMLKFQRGSLSGETRHLGGDEAGRSSHDE
jgi:excisionase family DNA binding protein